MTDCRNDIVAWGHWAISNKHQFTYTEGATRMAEIGEAGHLPVTCDCSAFVTLCYNWAGVHSDPNGQHYDHEGYTGTLLANGIEVPLHAVAPGDVVIYGAGTGEHAALIIENHNGRDIMTISMGQEGDPSYVWVNAPVTVPDKGVGHDSRMPQRFLRFNTTGTPHTPPAVQAAAPAVQAAEQLVAEEPKEE